VLEQLQIAGYQQHHIWNSDVLSGSGIGAFSRS
jgi:hypothetical protein